MRNSCVAPKPYADCCLWTARNCEVIEASISQIKKGHHDHGQGQGSAYGLSPDAMALGMKGSPRPSADCVLF